MKLRTILMMVVLILIAIFAAINWTAFLVPTQLSLVLTDFQAPLGLLMLGIVIVLTAFFLMYIMLLQTSALFETRRMTKQLDTQRGLADQAEKSRFFELRTYLQNELQQLQQQQNTHLSTLTRQLEAVQQALEQRSQLTENALAAQIGELDDRLQRVGVGNQAGAGTA